MTRKIAQRPARKAAERKTEKIVRSKNDPILYKAPIAQSRKTGSREPKMQQGPKTLRIRHTEFLGSILSTDTIWNIRNYLRINPGLAGVFPWLSIVAAGWERYKFHKLNFKFLSRSPSTYSGSVQMIPEYDVADDPPIGEAIANTYSGFVEDSVWKDIECRLDPKMLNAVAPSGKLVRTGLVPSGGDILQYDAAQFFVASSGSAVGTQLQLGKLAVEYDVELINPQMSPHGTSQARTFFAESDPSALATNSDFLGLKPIIAPNSMTDVVAVRGNIVFFNVVGRYCVEMQMKASNSMSFVNPTLGAGINLLRANDAVGTTVTPQQLQRQYWIEVTNPSAAFIQVNDLYTGSPANGTGVIGVYELDPNIQLPPL